MSSQRCVYFLCKEKEQQCGRRQKVSWINTACRVAGSSYVTQVFHGHPGCGDVKVRSLAPFALHIFIVILLIFQLLETEIIGVMQFLKHLNLLWLTKHAGHDRNLWNFSPLLDFPLALDAADDIRQQVDGYSEPRLKVSWALVSLIPNGCTEHVYKFCSGYVEFVWFIYHNACAKGNNPGQITKN